MNNKQVAIVLGASGSVGKALVDELLQTGSFVRVVTLVRRSQPDQLALARKARVELQEILVPQMDPEKLEQATEQAASSQEAKVCGLSVLGVGAGTGKMTLEEHRAVDVALNAAFARGLKASAKVMHLALMTSVGANAQAPTSGSGTAGMARYLCVKGEAEEAVKGQGPAVVSLFRPALIIGSAHTPWLLETIIPAFSWVTPDKYKSITVQQIARAMIATCLHVPAQSAAYHYSDMVKLAMSLAAEVA